MKRCPRCETEKDDSEFYRNPKTGKLHAFCRPCKREWETERRVLHREEYRANSKAYRERHPEKAAESQRKWKSKNKDRVDAIYDKWAETNRLEYEAKRRAKVRDEVFQAYGGFRCVCCGEDEPIFLTIDHINNDGNEHRKELATKIGKGGTAFFDWLRRNKFPPGFQVLCRNCNWGKHANGGVCPHQRKP